MAWGWRRKKKNKQDGKLPLGLVEETLRSGARRRGRGKTWPVSLFAGKGNRTGPWDTGMRTLHTAFASLHLAAQPPSVVDRPSSTRFITQLSARSRADCSFRLAISKKRNVEQRLREGGAGLERPPSCHFHIAQAGRSRSPVQERVEHFAESNTCNACVRWTKHWADFPGLGFFPSHSWAKWSTYSRSQLCLLKTLTSTNLLLIFEHPLSVSLLFLTWCYLLVLSSEGVWRIGLGIFNAFQFAFRCLVSGRVQRCDVKEKILYA